MFEFVQSRNKKLKPTRLVYIARIASFLIHVMIIAILIRFPELLEGGKFKKFHPLSFFYHMMNPQTAKQEDLDWRTVAVLSPNKMPMPTPETLKKLLKNSKKEEEPKSPKIRVRWGDEQKAAIESLSHQPIRPPDQRTSKPASQAAEAASNANSNNGHSETKPTPPAVNPPAAPAAQLPPTPLNKDAMSFPTPAVKNTPPPNATADVHRPLDSPSPTKPQAKIFEDEQHAIANPGSGFFNTDGFPLGEYTTRIKERIEGNWLIPSFLKHSKGNTTIIFYIKKDGGYEECRIIASSGNKSLDIAALKAVMDSVPFPPLPKGFPGNRIGAKFVLSYNQ
jgi:TonB family protein